jgi:hypothetical protein
MCHLISLSCISVFLGRVRFLSVHHNDSFFLLFFFCFPLLLNHSLTPLSSSSSSLGSAATLDSEPFLRATAACFREAWRAVEVLKEICGGTMSVEGCEDVV